jgi:hypothetical protein
MSYAGKESRSQRASAAGSGGRLRSGAASRVIERELPLGARRLARTASLPRVEDGETDWQQVAIFAAGAVLGVAIGAGAALLLAPQSGEEARHGLARQGRRLRARTADAWDDLRDELRYAAGRSRRKVGRALRRRRERRELHDESALDD